MAKKLSIVVFVLFLVSTAWSQESTLMQAYRVLHSRDKVDLTHSFTPDSPVWEGFGQAIFTRAADPETGEPYSLEKHGFRAMHYSLVGQYGTHIDPPAHFQNQGQTVDQIPLQQMILPLVVFDITQKIKDEPAYSLSVADVLAWEKEHGPVPPGSFVALRTDMSKDWESDPERFKRHPFPGWSLAALQFLYLRRGAVANGHESLDTDCTSTMESETWLLQHGHWQIEVMANLDKVPTSGALIVVSWPKPKGGLGFPARAYAILP